jgi:hypothetical protein
MLSLYCLKGIPPSRKSVARSTFGYFASSCAGLDRSEPLSESSLGLLAISCSGIVVLPSFLRDGQYYHIKPRL